MSGLTLHFMDNELWLTQFEAFNSKPLQCIRGKTGGAIPNAGTFQWTSAVQSLCCVIIQAVIESLDSEALVNKLSGGKGSLAISLDYAISKEVMWLQDMFGVDSKGYMTAKRVILRTNPNCKRPGPVILALNQKFIPTTKISILINNHECRDVHLLRNLLDAIIASQQKSHRGAVWTSCANEVRRREAA